MRDKDTAKSCKYCFDIAVKIMDSCYGSNLVRSLNNKQILPYAIQYMWSTNEERDNPYNDEDVVEPYWIITKTLTWDVNEHTIEEVHKVRMSFLA